MIYQVTEPGWLEPGWYIRGRENSPPRRTREEIFLELVRPYVEKVQQQARDEAKEDHAVLISAIDAALQELSR
jgi:hypothetical protein